MRKLHLTMTLRMLTAATVLACLAMAGYSDEKAARPAAGGVSVGTRLSEEAQEYYADLLIPAWERDDALLLLDLRGTFLEDKEQELNVGLVARRLFRDRGFILGGNFFYDNRWTENDNLFDQLGAGAELLSRWVDVRFNYYYPIEDEEAVSEFTEVDTSVRTEGGRTITTTTTSLYRIFEEPLEGYDGEIGFWLPLLRDRMPTAVYVGYYDYSSDFEDDFSGVKGRLESRVHPNITLDAEWFEDDDLNRTDYFAGIRFHAPIDFWNGLSFAPRAGGDASGLDALKARMSDMVNRDFRIRTITTLPVLKSQQIEESSGSTRAPSVATTPEPIPLPSNCRIDPITGDVVCD
jgi:hypothetical protein